LTQSFLQRRTRYLIQTFFLTYRQQNLHRNSHKNVSLGRLYYVNTQFLGILYLKGIKIFGRLSLYTKVMGLKESVTALTLYIRYLV
jgi:hypothetical protein